MKQILALCALVVCLISTAGGCATSRPAKPNHSVIAVDSTGSLTLNGHPTSIAELSHSLSAHNLSAGEAIVITADNNTPYEHIVGVLNELRLNDYWNISFATTQ